MPPGGRPSDSMVGGVYRDGKILYISRYAKLPRLCIRCAKPVEGKSIEIKCSWHPWWLYFLRPHLFPLFLLPHELGQYVYDAVMRLMGAEEFDLEVYVCPAHRSYRVLVSLLGIMIWISALIVVVIFIDHGGLYYGLLLLLVAHVCVRVLAITPRATYIDERYGTFKGAGNPFLDQLHPKPPLWLPTTTLNL